MMIAAGLGGALLLLAAQAPGSLPIEPLPQTAAQTAFAPPVDQDMVYRVTTRRVGRDGALISFSLVYSLQWQHAGRGYRLAATLQRIDSDARPDVTRTLTALIAPLVGETVTYLVASGGRSVEMVDSDGLWERVVERTRTLAAGAAPGKARQIAQIMAALPAEERRRLASADIRALVAPANTDIPVAGVASVSIMQDGAVRTVAQTLRDTLAVGAGARPLETDSHWTIDTAMGLVLREQKQSWIAQAQGGPRTLIEERIRSLQGAAER